MPSKKPSAGKNQPDDASQLPLDLGADLSALIETAVGKTKKKDPALTAPGRIERVTSREDFTAAIKALGGDQEAIRVATGAMYKVIFKMSAAQLYGLYGVPNSKRDFLPAVVQQLIQVHELVNAERLRNHTLPQGMDEQNEINNHIVVIVRKQTESTEIFLTTFNLFRGALGPKHPALKPKPSISVDTEYGPIECEVLEVDEGDIPF